MYARNLFFVRALPELAIQWLYLSQKVLDIVASSLNFGHVQSAHSLITLCLRLAQCFLGAATHSHRLPSSGGITPSTKLLTYYMYARNLVFVHALPELTIQ